MAGRKASSGLTEAELRIMDALWQESPATVGDVTERVAGTPRPAYNTVLTILRILERKGYVRHEQDGRRYTYSPLIDRGQARRRALRQLLGRFFGNSEELLVMELLGREDPAPDQLERLRTLLDDEREALHSKGRRRA
ncbi:MAG: BlaI/MecI/CopY family transcriptional regulator [Vicinamibacterales bacterium]